MKPWISTITYVNYRHLSNKDGPMKNIIPYITKSGGKTWTGSMRYLVYASLFPLVMDTLKDPHCFAARVRMYTK